MEKEDNKAAVVEALLSNDFDKLKQTVHAFFALIPHDWYRKNQLAGYEGYYASIVYCYFAALGLDVRPEETPHVGRIDLTIRFEGRVIFWNSKWWNSARPAARWNRSSPRDMPTGSRIATLT